jgi:SAM-dependent methyltransferase
MYPPVAAISELSMEPDAATRRALTNVTLLLPVWGSRFVARFLEFCLPTLLAPGNIPALAAELPCRFVLLSRENELRLIESHPVWQQLEALCAVEIQPIDDLITESNHTATITLAFERVLRQAGSAVRETCFIFLMSDYLVADGSLKNVLAAVRNGADAVLVGNFQVTAEEFVPLLRAEFDPASTEIVLPARRLIQWSLGHLHEATAANIVNFGLAHNAHTNRLFWRVDENTLIGRFYLMHPIAIHPLVEDFVVGSSWDYSFVPELCPSGRVAVLGDSDDYLVVELQRRGYENENLRAGPVTAQEVAHGLAEWATAQHRANAQQSLVFHAAELPLTLAEFMRQAGAFVEDVQRLLVTPPLSHRRHPYWVGSLAVHHQRTKRPLSKQDWLFLLGEKPESSPNTLLRHMRWKIFGFPPAVTRVHLQWPDYALAMTALNDTLSRNGNVLLVVDDPGGFAQWVVRTAGSVFTIRCEQLLTLPGTAYLPLLNSFDLCLLVLDEGSLESSDVLLDHILPLLREKGQVLFIALNKRPLHDASLFGQQFAIRAARLSEQTAWVEEVTYVPTTRAAWVMRAFVRQQLITARAQRPLRPFAALGAPVALLVTYLLNVLSKPRPSPPITLCSSVFVKLRVAGSRKLPLRFQKDLALKSRREPAAALSRLYSLIPSGDAAANNLTVETSSSLREDPAQFVLLLASYRFVANLFSDRHDIAEVGCATTRGTDLVLQQVRKLTVFDSRPAVLRRLSNHFSEDPAITIYEHDILHGPLPRKADSAYSVNYLQYLSPDEEDAFIRNIRDSVRDSDFVLIGCPSQPMKARRSEGRWGMANADYSPLRIGQTQTAYGSALASEPGVSPYKAGKLVASTFEPTIHIRTAEQLKVTMARHFHNVVTFSMMEASIQAGSFANAQHVFALGCGNKH